MYNHTLYKREYRKRDYVKKREKEYEKYRRPKYKLMDKLRKEWGGMCVLCGYNEEIRILHFHHLRDKIFALSDRGHSYKEMQKEAEKCVLLCPNCHALIHLKSFFYVSKT